MAVNGLDHLAPAGVLALGCRGLRPLRVGGREEGGSIVLPPMRLPPRPNQEALQGFVNARTVPGAKVYTDEHGGYIGLENHEVVKHSARVSTSRIRPIRMELRAFGHSSNAATSGPTTR